MPRSLSFLLKIKIKQPHSTFLSVSLSLFLTLSLSPTLSLPLSLSLSLPLSLRRSPDWLNDERLEHARTFCFARGSIKCGRALTVPHSVNQSDSMRDYYINGDCSFSGLVKVGTHVVQGKKVAIKIINKVPTSLNISLCQNKLRRCPRFAQFLRAMAHLGLSPVWH